MVNLGGGYFLISEVPLYRQDFAASQSLFSVLHSSLLRDPHLGNVYGFIMLKLLYSVSESFPCHGKDSERIHSFLNSFAASAHRGTSLTRRRTLPGPCSRTMLSVLRWSSGGGRVFMGEVPLYRAVLKLVDLLSGVGLPLGGVRGVRCLEISSVT